MQTGQVSARTADSVHHLYLDVSWSDQIDPHAC